MVTRRCDRLQEFKKIKGRHGEIESWALRRVKEGNRPLRICSRFLSSIIKGERRKEGKGSGRKFIGRQREREREGEGVWRKVCREREKMGKLPSSGVPYRGIDLLSTWAQRGRKGALTRSAKRLEKQKSPKYIQSASSPQSQCFVLFSLRGFGYQLGCTIATVSAQRPVEYVKNVLQNITTEGTPRNVNPHFTVHLH